MANSRLYKEARAQFIRDCEARYVDSKDLHMLRDFLSQNGSPEEAQAAAHTLKTDAGKKWGSRKVGDTEIPAAWIDKLMANMANFVAVGNYAMKGAPESVGLAWFGVKLALSAIQSNYDLYAFFGSGLTDISEIMIIIPHYDRLYDERVKEKSEWKPSPLMEKLFQDIISTYAAVLSFSFSIRRHLSAGTLAKLRHGFKDFFGSSKIKFQAKMDTIASLKKKVVESSQAIFQDKSFQHLDSVKSIVSNIEGTVNQIKDFQATLQNMHDQQNAQFELVLKRINDISLTNKPKNPWQEALLEFEKNKDALRPQQSTSEALGVAIDQRHPGTCEWVPNNPAYIDWKNSRTNSLLCVCGHQGSGKSIVLANIVERHETDEDVRDTLLYLSCAMSGESASRRTPNATEVCHTLLYQLYSLAREDESNPKLLEDCNKVFDNPKAQKIGSIIKQNNKDENLPEFTKAFWELAEQLKVHIIIALDGVDELSPGDQKELALKLEALLTATEGSRSKDISVKAVLGCRSGTRFHHQVLDSKGSTWSIDVGEHNDEDMAKKLADELKEIPGITQAERDESTKAILEKAGPRFAYLDDIAVPFMREPFQRPLSDRLESLPEGMNHIYHEALRKLSPNYLGLLRTALKWTLLAPVSLTVEEIMDAYHNSYSSRDGNTEEEALNMDQKGFDKAPKLQIDQLRDASGAFLRVEEPVFENHFVNLQDPLQIRDFCMFSGKLVGSEDDQNDGICTRCKSALSEFKALSICPKEGHLELALACVRHLNNPIFQKRATANEQFPQWVRPADTEDANVDPGHGQIDDDPEMSKSMTIGEPNGEEEPLLNRPEDAPRSDSKGDIEGVSTAENLDAKPSDEVAANATTDNTGYDSDDSMDEEDRGEINLAKLSAAVDDGDDDGEYVSIRQRRYELLYWTHHLRQAEELWTPEERRENGTWAELMGELDHLASANPSFFRWWQQCEDENSEDSDHYDPLHVAAYFGLTSWAEHLLRKGTDVNGKSGSVYALTPIQLAAAKANSRSMLKFLLENGADPNVDGDLNIPAFHTWLFQESSLETVQLWLHHGADPTVSDEKNKWTALHYFAWGGNDVEALELLLNASMNGVNPDINSADLEGSIPLHVLLWRREVPKPLLRAFVENGADINKDGSHSARPLQLASTFGDLEALQILCNNQTISELDDDDLDGDSALQQAAIGNHSNCLKFLAELGANTNMQNKRGRVALHNSAWSGERDCVEILISHGAQLNILDKHDRSPLFFACLGESVDIADLLLGALLDQKVPMAEINTLTKRRRSPLRQAAARGFDVIVEKMIKAAQDEGDAASLAINESDTRKGMTPLHRAAWFGRQECVRLLLAAGADATIQDQKEKTALVIAYEQWALANDQSAFEEIISLLVASEPKMATADAELVAICAANGSTRLLQQLSSLGADLNRQDRYGWTPLDLARNFQQTAAEQFLKRQAAWAGMLPSRWVVDPLTEASADGRSLKHTQSSIVCISTDKPLPAGLDMFYFEVAIKKQSEEEASAKPEWPTLAIGFCTIGGRAIRFPGWCPRQDAPSARSWGYHGDDGGLFYSGNPNSLPVDFEPRYQPGNTIGCGVDLKTRTMWFTRNGQKLGAKFNNISGRLFPLLGFEDEIELEINFTGPFLWKDGEHNEKDSLTEETAK